jgi:hypothetical protein
MGDFWQHLKAAWNYGRQFPYVEAADAEDYWTVDDARAMASFFNSPAGQKLRTRLMNWSLRMALAAVRNKDSSPYMNGQASGVDATIAAIDAHLPIQLAEQDEEQTETQQIAEAMGT